jgi:hypothetical protein
MSFPCDAVHQRDLGCSKILIEVDLEVRMATGTQTGRGEGWCRAWDGHLDWTAWLHQYKVFINAEHSLWREFRYSQGSRHLREADALFFERPGCSPKSVDAG